MAISADTSEQPTDDRVTLVQQLFLKHSNSIRGYLLAFTPNLSDVDDLLQMAFMAVQAKADAFEPGTNFVAWARAVARIELLRRLREQSLGPTTLPADVIETLTADAPELDTGNERLVALAECIKGLSPRSREAVTQRYSHARKPTEIAKTLSLATESVYVMLSRARATLRKCVEHKLRVTEAGG